MAGFFKRLFSGQPRALNPVRSTGRRDWERLTLEIYNRVIEGTRFGIGIAATQEGGKACAFASTRNTRTRN